MTGQGPMRLIVSSVISLLLLQAVSAAAQESQAPAAAPSAATAGLVTKQSSRAQFVQLRPGANWSKFRTIELGALKIPLDVRDTTPSGASRRFRESWVL